MNASQLTLSMDDARQVLHERFGLDDFRHGQEAVISRLLEGKSCAAIFPTGGGKSLCYQLPATMLPGLTLVVSPLLALMREQVDALCARGIRARRLDSSLTVDELRETQKSIEDGSAQILYVAPERFFNERFRGLISEAHVSLFAVDEAHCISQWGHNFRPDYLKLARIAREIKAERVLALTATATPSVLADIQQEFSIAPADSVQTPFFRENLQLRFTLCDEASRRQTLIERVENSEGASLIYVTLQQTAEQVASLLQDQGFDARPYHAGMDSSARQETQDWFVESDSGIVVATIAFGMGIDKSNIRSIFHYNPSKSIENYAQEVGRAGRDGELAVCETLLVPDDRVVLENFAYADTPSVRSLQQFVEFLMASPTSFFVSHYSLAYETDIRESVIRTLLTYLELQDLLEATASRYETYRFKPRLSSGEMLNQLDDSRRKFATSVLALSVKKRIWFELNLVHAIERLGCQRERLIAMLDYFAAQGWIELKASGLVHGYRKITPIGNPEALAKQLHQYLLDREMGELGRLSELFNLMSCATCQSAALSQHFGQACGECGTCTACMGQAISAIPTDDQARVGDSARSGVQELAKKYPEQLGDIRQQARFLCGLSSPRMIRKRLTREPLYGCCSHIPMDQVMLALSEFS